MFTSRTFLPLMTAITLISAPGCRRPEPSELDAARLRMEQASGERRCAEAEFEAAERLIAQAEAAWERRDYDAARQLAAAAETQTERAEQAAANNPDCQERDTTATATTTTPAATTTRPPSDYDGTYTFAPVYFEFDAWTLSPESRRTLEAHASYLREHPATTLVLYGHCDDAGSTDYTLALGQRRANMVREFLIGLGISGERMRSVSYGEEQPASRDNSALNRRTEFSVR